MNLSNASRMLMDCYPRIYLACHRRHVRDTALRRVLSAHQASILDHLDDVDPTSMTALALHMGVTPSTMSLAIDRLERMGYVARQRDREDARRVGLRLTTHGVRMKQSSSVLDPDTVRSMLRRLSPRKRERALRGLELIAAAASEEVHHRSVGRHWRNRSAVANLPGD